MIQMKFDWKHGDVKLKETQCIALILFGNKGHVVGPFFYCSESEKYGRVRFVDKKRYSMKSAIEVAGV